jgi:hypothetical protein
LSDHVTPAIGHLDSEEHNTIHNGAGPHCACADLIILSQRAERDRLVSLLTDLWRSLETEIGWAGYDVDLRSAIGELDG